MRGHRSMIERRYTLTGATREEYYSKRIKLLRMVIDMIDIYFTNVTIVFLVCRVYVVVTGVIVRLGMIFDRERIVKLPHYRRVQEGAEQERYSYDPAYVPYLHDGKSI